MTRAPILIRVDGTRTQGWESMWRCVTYAAALQRRRRPTFFLSQIDPPELVQNVKRGGNEWIEAVNPIGTDEDLHDTIEEIRRLSPAVIIVDGSNITGGYLRTLRATGIHGLAINHQAQTKFTTLLLVNPLLGPSKEAYQ